MQNYLSMTREEVRKFCLRVCRIDGLLESKKILKSVITEIIGNCDIDMTTDKPIAIHNNLVEKKKQ